jgi:archaellum component FlaC
MSEYTIPTSNTVTTIDPQATKIRELQSDVNELKELVEYLQDRIRKLKKAGDDLDSWLGRETPVTVRINWRQVKEGKQ